MFTFGLRPTDGTNPKYWWGARAIFSNKFVTNRDRRRKTDPLYVQEVTLDLLYDRQSYAGPEGSKEGDEKFTNWINKVGLPAVKKWAAGVCTDSRDVFNFEDKEYHITATPNGSYGYMYIGAWSIEEKEVNDVRPQAQG